MNYTIDVCYDVIDLRNVCDMYMILLKRYNSI